MQGSLVPSGGVLQSQDGKTSGKVDMLTLKTLQGCLVFIRKGTFVLRRLNDRCIVLFVGFQSVVFQVCILSAKNLNC